jgi:hypothetical protein
MRLVKPFIDIFSRAARELACNYGWTRRLEAHTLVPGSRAVEREHILSHFMRSNVCVTTVLLVVSSRNFSLHATAFSFNIGMYQIPGCCFISGSVHVCLFGQVTYSACFSFRKHLWRWNDDMMMLFVAAPAAGGDGGGSSQAGHDDRAECDHRGKYITGRCK